MEDAGKLGPGPHWELKVALWIRPSLGSIVGAGVGGRELCPFFPCASDTWVKHNGTPAAGNLSAGTLTHNSLQI